MDKDVDEDRGNADSDSDSDSDGGEQKVGTRKRTTWCWNLIYIIQGGAEKNNKYRYKYRQI